MKGSEIRNGVIKSKVRHTRFGEGTITKAMDNYLTIRFSTKESKFLFPDSFEKFIKAEDPTLQEEVLDLIKKKKDELDRHQQEEEERKFEKEQNKQVSEITKKRRDVEAGFGKDYNVKYLAKQPILTYQDVEEQFGIKISGFGRGINVTPSTIVLISSVDKKKEVLFIMIIGLRMGIIFILAREKRESKAKCRK